MQLNEYRGIWVLIETEDGKAKNVGYELLASARDLARETGEQVVAVLLGSRISDLAPIALHYGADQVLVVDDSTYADYNAQAYCHALATLIERHKPSAVLIGATDNGRDLAPCVSCRVDTGLIADCTAISVQPDTRDILWTRPAFGGNLMASIVCANHRPQMGTVRPGIFTKLLPDTSRTGNIRIEQIPVDTSARRVELLHRAQELGQEVDFNQADVIVSGGRGMGSKQNFALIQELAKALNGVVGASRAAVQEGWIPYAHQVGQSGKTVKPKLYIACGISGSVQHLAGISGADQVVAVNSDPDAPIFQRANYAVVADALEFIPALLQILQPHETDLVT